MKKLFKIVKSNAISIAVMAVLIGIVIWGFSYPHAKIYNCDMAEFHPDYPVKVREACRELRRKTQ